MRLSGSFWRLNKEAAKAISGLKIPYFKIQHCLNLRCVYAIIYSLSQSYIKAMRTEQDLQGLPQRIGDRPTDAYKCWCRTERQLQTIVSSAMALSDVYTRKTGRAWKLFWLNTGEVDKILKKESLNNYLFNNYFNSNRRR